MLLGLIYSNLGRMRNQIVRDGIIVMEELFKELRVVIRLRLRSRFQRYPQSFFIRHNVEARLALVRVVVNVFVISLQVALFFCKFRTSFENMANFIAEIAFDHQYSKCGSVRVDGCSDLMKHFQSAITHFERHL